jgi:hypothetical protein
VERRAFSPPFFRLGERQSQSDSDDPGQRDDQVGFVFSTHDLSGAAGFQPAVFSSSAGDKAKPTVTIPVKGTIKSAS